MINNLYTVVQSFGLITLNRDWEINQVNEEYKLKLAHSVCLSTTFTGGC